MSITSMHLLPRESEEDNASQNIIYGIYFLLTSVSFCLIVESIVIAASHLNKVFGSSVLLEEIKMIFFGLFLCDTIAAGIEARDGFLS